MDRYTAFHFGRCEYCDRRYGPYHINVRPEPWSRRRIIVTWVVTALVLLALAVGAPLLRNSNERSWCSSSREGPVSQQCLAEQRAIRCGPLGVLHCPPGGD